MKPTVQRLPIIFLLLSLMLAGCSNSPYTPGQTAKSVLYRPINYEPKTLDPSIAYDLEWAPVVGLIYPSYFRYHYLKQDPYILELNLGAAQPKRERFPVTVTEKGKKPGDKGKQVQKIGERWTFRIKPNLRFQDDPCFPGGKGRAITAQDFLYSLHRVADPTVNSPILDFLADKVIGLQDAVDTNIERQKNKQLIDLSAPIAGFEADPKDPYTFRVILNQPYPQLRFLMAMSFTTPIPHEAVETYKEEFARHPVGCGLYMMDEYTPKMRAVLKVNPNRNEEFYPTDGAPGDRENGLLDDAGKRLPLADMIQFSILKEPTAQWTLFQQGYLDAIAVSSNNSRQVVTSNGELTPQMKAHGIRLRKSPTPNIWYIAFRMDDPVVGGYTPERRKLRQALSLAVDSASYIDLIAEGRARTAEFLVPPGIFGYDPNFKNPYRQFDPNLTKAKQLLAEAGYPNGISSKTGDRLEITYAIPEFGASGRQTEGFLQKQFEALGIKWTIQTQQSSVWEDHIKNGQFQMTRYSWYADYPDPENFVFMLYGPNKGVNYTGYNNPEYNRLFEQMRSMDDGPARLAIINKMRAIAVEDCPWIYWYHGESQSVGYDWAKNSKPHGVANDTLKYIRVDGPRRANLQAEWNKPNYWPLLAVGILLFAGSVPAAQTIKRRRNRSVRRSNSEATR